MDDSQFVRRRQWGRITDPDWVWHAPIGHRWSDDWLRGAQSIKDDQYARLMHFIDGYSIAQTRVDRPDDFSDDPDSLRDVIDGLYSTICYLLNSPDLNQTQFREVLQDALDQAHEELKATRTEFEGGFAGFDRAVMLDREANDDY